MRLIDADKIPYVDDETNFREYDYAYRYAIDAEPTIDAVPMDWIMKYYEDHPASFVCGMIYDWAMEQAEGKDEYVTLHHEDIHFIDEDAERAFYELLAEEILEDSWDD